MLKDALDENDDFQGCTKLLSQEAKEGKGRVSEHIKHNEMLENSAENLIKPQSGHLLQRSTWLASLEDNMDGGSLELAITNAPENRRLLR